MESILHPLAVVTALVVGLMAGNELAVALFFHPALYRLPDRTHTQAAKMLAGLLGTVMPFWYAASFILSAVLAWFLRGAGPLPLGLASGGAALLLLMIIYTVTNLVPINNRIASWDLSALPADWKRDRQAWDARHRVRVGVLIVGFGLLVSAILSLPPR